MDLRSRSARRIELLKEFADAFDMAAQAWTAWDRNPLDPSNQLNYEAARENADRLARELAKLQEVES